MGGRIGLREVRALKPNSIVWDGECKGFAARRQGGIPISYVVKYRNKDGRQRWLTIGKHGSPWTPEMAREEARRLLVEVLNGADPATEKQEKRKAATVAELCASYLADAEAGRILVRGGKPKKPLTLASDRGRIADHIIPLLGLLPVAAVTRLDVERMMHAIAEGSTAQRRKLGPRALSRVHGGRGVATRTVGLLGAIFAYAVEHRMRPDNPAHGIRKYAENKRERRLSKAEYHSLGAALHAAVEARIWPAAVSCLRFLAVTGWRSGEAVNLRWRDIDVTRRTARLPDTKSGPSMRPLSHGACAVLAAMPHLSDGALVFPATRGDGPMLGFKKFARRIFVMGKLPADVTPHVLRHSFASLAADMGYSELAIASMLGHKKHTTTSRYTHAADAVLLAAADAVAARTAELMGEAEPNREVVQMRAAS